VIPTEPMPAKNDAFSSLKGGVVKYLKGLGPGLITGAADDDPSGISTYSVAGAQLGMVVLLTSDRKAMGGRVNSRAMKVLGWACALIMTVAAVGLLVSL